MGYGALFPVNQLGGLKNVLNLREYGVCEPWVTRESTVIVWTIFLVLLLLTTSVKLTKVSSTLAEHARISASPEVASPLVLDTGEEGQEATTAL